MNETHVCGKCVWMMFKAHRRALQRVLDIANKGGKDKSADAYAMAEAAFDCLSFFDGFHESCEGMGMSQMSPRMKKVLGDAEAIAYQRGAEYLGTEHVLLALQAETGGIAREALADVGVTGDKLLAAIDRLAPPTPKVCEHCQGTGKAKV